MSVSRRQLLAGAGAVALSPVLPNIQPLAQATPLPLYPVFEIGSEDYPNWRMIAAETLERAIQIFREDSGLCEGCDGLRCAEIDTHGDCEHSDLTGRKLGEKVVPAQTAEGDIAAGLHEMYAAGWKHECSRCYYDDPDDWIIVEDKAVCMDCLSPQEWSAHDHDTFVDKVINEDFDLSDLAVFALLRPEDLAEDGVREALAGEAELHPDCLWLAPFAERTSP